MFDCITVIGTFFLFSLNDELTVTQINRELLRWELRHIEINTDFLLTTERVKGESGYFIALIQTSEKFCNLLTTLFCEISH